MQRTFLLCFGLSALLHGAVLLLVPEFATSRSVLKARVGEPFMARLQSARSHLRQQAKPVLAQAKPPEKPATPATPMLPRVTAPQVELSAPRVALLPPQPIVPTAPPVPPSNRQRMDKIDLHAAFAEVQQARQLIALESQRTQHMAWMQHRVEQLAHQVTAALSIPAQTLCSASAVGEQAAASTPLQWHCPNPEWAQALAQAQGEFQTLAESLVRMSEGTMQLRLGAAQALVAATPTSRASQ